MTIRDRIIREVAQELGISIKAAENVVRMQCLLIRKTMKAKEPRSVYLRGVGTFIPRVVSQNIARLKKVNREERLKQQNNIEEEDPLEFE